MNNTFNIKRFDLAFRKELIENMRRYTLLMITMLGLTTLVIILNKLNYCMNYINTNGDSYKDSTYLNLSLLIYLILAFFAFGIWFSSTFSTSMNSKLKRISYLVTPTSNLEKYFVHWIITTIGFIFTFFIAAWIGDIIGVSICSVVYPDVDIQFLDFSKLFAPLDLDHEKRAAFAIPHDYIPFVISAYFLLQSIFLLGSTFWEKMSFLKTFSSLAIIISVFFLTCRWMILLVYGGKINGYANVLNSYELGDSITEYQAILWVSAIMVIFALIFWILAYFRMKESEIIKRL